MSSALPSYAEAAAIYTRDHRSAAGKPHLLDPEYGIGDGESDNGGFNGIFARWCGLWATQTRNKDILNWLHDNASAALKQQNKAGLIWGHWEKPTPETGLAAWECSSAVALLQDIPVKIPH